MTSNSLKRNIVIAISYLISTSAIAFPSQGQSSFIIENISGYTWDNRPIYDKVILTCDNGHKVEVTPFGSSLIDAGSVLGVDNATRQCELTAEQNKKIISLATFSISYDDNSGALKHSPITYNQTQVCNAAYKPICDHDVHDPYNFYLTASRHYDVNNVSPCICNYQN